MAKRLRSACWSALIPQDIKVPTFLILDELHAIEHRDRVRDLLRSIPDKH
jgi:hypothetical protein